jgi:hypothetical protein
VWGSGGEANADSGAHSRPFIRGREAGRRGLLSFARVYRALIRIELQVRQVTRTLIANGSECPFG